MIRQVASDLYVVGECIEGEHHHESVRVYVLKNGKRPVLIDTGARIQKEGVMKSLEDVLDGLTPEVVFLTHGELPHAGNIRTIVSRWPTTTVAISSLTIPYMDVTRVAEKDYKKEFAFTFLGTTDDFAGRRLEFIGPALRDQAMSQWIFDPKTGALFCADAFGYYHAPGRCELFSDEEGGAIHEKDMLDYHRDAFQFLRWVNPAPVKDEMDKVLERDVKIIAPTHGNPIRSDIRGHADMMIRVVGSIRNEWMAKRQVLAQ